jgi:hypothetical protein
MGVVIEMVVMDEAAGLRLEQQDMGYKLYCMSSDGWWWCCKKRVNFNITCAFGVCRYV